MAVDVSRPERLKQPHETSNPVLWSGEAKGDPRLEDDFGWK